MKKKAAGRSRAREDVAETAYRTLQEAIGEWHKTFPPPSERAEKKSKVAKRGRKGATKKGRKS